MARTTSVNSKSCSNASASKVTASVAKSLMSTSGCCTRETDAVSRFKNESFMGCLLGDGLRVRSRLDCHHAGLLTARSVSSQQPGDYVPEPPRSQDSRGREGAKLPQTAWEVEALAIHAVV